MIPPPDDLELVARLLARYRATFREEHYAGMWKKIFDRYHRPLHEAFMRGNAEEAAAILRDPRASYLCFGYEMHKDGTEVDHHDTGTLRQLAHALGALPLPNPEKASLTTELRQRWRRFRDRHASADSVLEAIDSRIDFPNPFAREYGLVTGRGIAGYRAIMAIHQAKLLKGRVLEIGGGLGRTAYYAARFGVTDYTIVDLPFTAIVQGYFLGRTLGEHRVKLMTPDEFFASNDTYDVALNADSLTELVREVAERYASAIKVRAKRFVSINHEANSFTVSELMGAPAVRGPYWLRAGYVEEHFTMPTA